MSNEGNIFESGSRDRREKYWPYCIVRATKKANHGLSNGDIYENYIIQINAIFAGRMAERVCDTV